jgi:hypothetical protein
MAASPRFPGQDARCPVGTSTKNVTEPRRKGEKDDD